MIDLTPDPYGLQIGSLPIYWYGVCYAVGLFGAYQVMVREARRRGLDATVLTDGMIIVAIAALIGGRAYHVIDQWARYQSDPITAILPIQRLPDGSYAFAGFSGLGVYGGIFTGIVAAVLFTRWKLQPFWRWADVVAPGLFVMQAIGRWGNFFNQELYGPPTNVPWGIAIQCKNRVAAYACPPGSDPNATLGQHFHPLFLYESISALIGLVFLLWLGRRFSGWLRAGDLLLVFLIWYSLTRFSLEFLRAGYNWTVGGVATAQIVAGATILVALALFVWRHSRPGPSVGEIEAAEQAERAGHAASEGGDPEPAPPVASLPEAGDRPEPGVGSS